MSDKSLVPELYVETIEMDTFEQSSTIKHSSSVTKLFAFLSDYALFMTCFFVGIFMMNFIYSQNDVNFVKASYLVNYESTSIGEAFDMFFTNKSWESFETDSHQVIVEFSGEVWQENEFCLL